MGARSFVRGVSSGPPRPARPTKTFNGAADLHPRSGLQRGDPAGATKGTFNGAADLHPRSADPIHLPDRDAAPSMGPRIFIRGVRTHVLCARGVVGPSMGPRIFIRGVAGVRQ